MNAYVYRRLGLMTYEVHERVPARFLGVVWKTRTGWSARLPSGRVITEDYPGSRDVPAGLLKAEADRLNAADRKLIEHGRLRDWDDVRNELVEVKTKLVTVVEVLQANDVHAGNAFAAIAFIEDQLRLMSETAIR